MDADSGLAVHRLNTYVFIHQGFFHMLMNALALTPLLERFEAEHGTLVTVAMFIGREWIARIRMAVLTTISVVDFSSGPIPAC